MLWDVILELELKAREGARLMEFIWRIQVLLLFDLFIPRHSGRGNSINSPCTISG